MNTIEKAIDYFNEHKDDKNAFAIADAYFTGATEQAMLDRDAMISLLYNLVEIGDITVKSMPNVVASIRTHII